MLDLIIKVGRVVTPAGVGEMGDPAARSGEPERQPLEA